MEEKIICSAIWYKGLETANSLPENIYKGVVICGHRHHNCINTLLSLTGKRTVNSEVGETVQGFLTNKNRFVDRIEGAEIALSSNQISELKYRNKKLFSEDLY